MACSALKMLCRIYGTTIGRIKAARLCLPCQSVGTWIRRRSSQGQDKSAEVKNLIVAGRTGDHAQRHELE